MCVSGRVLGGWAAVCPGGTGVKEGIFTGPWRPGCCQAEAAFCLQQTNTNTEAAELLEEVTLSQALVNGPQRKWELCHLFPLCLPHPWLQSPHFTDKATEAGKEGACWPAQSQAQMQGWPFQVWSAVGPLGGDRPISGIRVLGAAGGARGWER